MSFRESNADSRSSVPVGELQRRKDYWRPRSGTLIDDLVAQQMRADGEQRGVIEVGLIIT